MFLVICYSEHSEESFFSTFSCRGEICSPASGHRPPLHVPHLVGNTAPDVPSVSSFCHSERSEESYFFLYCIQVSLEASHFWYTPKVTKTVADPALWPLAAEMSSHA